MPISETITSAERLLTPGMVLSISMATRKGSTLPSTSLIDARQWRVQSIDLVQMQLEQEAVMVRYPATQRGFQFRRGGLESPSASTAKASGNGLAGNQGLDHAAAGEAQDVGHHRIQLDVGVLQRLLDALDMTDAFTHELLAGAEQIAHLLGRLVGHES